MATAARRRRPVDDADDYEEQETPRRRRRPAADEEDTRPRRRRPEPEDAEDDEAEEPPRRRRAVHRDDDEDDVEEAPRSRRRRAEPVNEDDEDEPPRRRRAAAAARPGRRVARGWAAYEKTKAKSSDFEKKFKPTAEESVVVLLEEDGPFATFARHWVELEEGKRAFICPASLAIDDDEAELECPLCDVGDKPNAPRAYLNVAVLEPGKKPELAVWEIGGAISDQLQMIDKSIGRRTKLTEIYIVATSKGTGLNTKYHLEPIFEEDLPELDLKPLTDKQRNAFELYDDELYQIPSFKELDRVADALV
ncbi:hypothetical protein ACIOHC_35875 [Streptomyces sp. NPDC088252]|uniref:hypothetical protein n=1 Tax=Streptomyces sp. NPDC088252 TaxID=3365845 RepID=UPI0037F2387F